MEVALAVLGKVGELLVEPVINQLSYLFCYQKHIKDLEGCVPNLESSRERIEIKIKKATDNLDNIHKDVEGWMSNATEVMQEAQQFLAAEAEATNKRCCGGPCPNLVLRHRRARKACKTKQRVDEVMKKYESGNLGKEVAYSPERQTTIKNEGYHAFGTRRETFERIKAALKSEEKTRMVLVHGMPGAGKTMMAQEIAKQVNDEKLFSKIIFTAVSKKPDYKKIQKDIADELGLKKLDDEEKLEERTHLLQKRLANESSVLIILDDVWDERQLSNIGIDFGDNQKGCKILVTSRSQDVLQNDRRATVQKFEIQNLSVDESITLFNSIVGDKATQGEFQNLATEIVSECGKLPLAISIVASALRNKDLDVWRDASENLKRCGRSGIHGVSDKVFNSLKLSYDFLGREAQELFLLFCLRKEDENVSLHLILTHGFGLGIYQDVYTLEQAILRFRKLVSELRDHSLLLEGRSNIYVKVHDVVRDFGLDVASSKVEPMRAMKSEEEFKGCHMDKKLQNAKALSLLYCNTVKLPEKLECPLVELLWMSKTRSSEVPDRFFEETKKLKVLDLSNSKLQQLPSSLGFLENLRVLNFRQCTLGDISDIGKLKLLQVLDLSWSTIEYLPEEIGQLSNLRVLAVFDCQRLKKIHRNVLPNLKELEELNMEKAFIEWEDGDERENASLTDLQELPNLKALHLEVSSRHIESTNLLMKRFSRYEISINTKTNIWLDNKLTAYTLHDSKIFKLNLEISALIGKLRLGTLLDSSEEVQLAGIRDADALIPQVNKQGFLETKHIALCRTEIQFIVSPFSSHPSRAFEKLESLRLHTLEKLEHICHRELRSGSFGRLQQLEINKCHELKSLFSFSVAKLLVQLQEINAKECNMIEEIITHDAQPSNNTATIALPQLQTIRLVSLPKLKTFVSNRSLEPSEETSVPLFGGQVEASALTYLEVSDCGSLEYLFSSTFASKLQELSYIKVTKCNMMEEIITTDQKLEEIRFPKLRYLKLENLPKLKKVSSGISIECTKMSELKMWKCKGDQKIIFAPDDA